MARYTCGMDTGKGEELSNDQEKSSLERSTAGIKLVFEDVTEVPDIPKTSPNELEEDYLVPMLADAGVCVFARREFRKVIRRKNYETYKIAKVMSDPREAGLSRVLFQDFGGEKIPMVEILMFRKDNVPFTAEDYYIIDDFVSDVFGSDPPFHITRRRWLLWCRNYRKSMAPISSIDFDRSHLMMEALEVSDDILGLGQQMSLLPLLDSNVLSNLYSQGNAIETSRISKEPPTGLVHCVRVSGMDLHQDETSLKHLSRKGACVPIVSACGLPPVYAMKEFTAPPEHSSAYWMIRLMRDFQTGVVSTNRRQWEVDLFHGLQLSFVFRKDGAPFTMFDFYVLQEFEAQMYDQYTRSYPKKMPVSSDWVAWAKEFISLHDSRGVSIENSPLLVQVKYPPGTTIYLQGLSHADLNGKKGVISSVPCIKVGRIGVKIDSRADPIAIKLCNVSFNEAK